MQHDKNHFEKYLERFPDAPSLILVRSAELKNYPTEFIKAPVLDLCCGDGFFLQSLGVRGAYGCDIDARSLECAKALTDTYADVKICDARKLDRFKNGEFGTILSNCALEHVDGIEMALSSIAAALKDGGHLIMSVPSDNLNDWYFPKLFFEKIGMRRYGKRLLENYNNRQAHVNLYSLKTWRQKLEDSGLRIEKSFYLFNRRDYMVGTFFDSLNGRFLARLYLILKVLPVSFRKFIWRKILKPLYERSQPLDAGGELVIVAKK